eukprot:3887294-Rhodomonas_salina.6
MLSRYGPCGTDIGGVSWGRRRLRLARSVNSESLGCFAGTATPVLMCEYISTNAGATKPVLVCRYARTTSPVLKCSMRVQRLEEERAAWRKELEVRRAICLRACYDISDTDLAHAAMRCPVLTWFDCRAMCGTEIAYAGRPCRAMCGTAIARRGASGGQSSRLLRLEEEEEQEEEEDCLLYTSPSPRDRG